MGKVDALIEDSDIGYSEMCSMGTMELLAIGTAWLE